MSTSALFFSLNFRFFSNENLRGGIVFFMKFTRKILCIIGILFIIIVPSTFFACEKSEKEIVCDFPVDYRMKIDAREQKKIKIEENIETFAPISYDKVLMSFYALAYESPVVEEGMLDKTYPNGFNKGEVSFSSIKINGEEKSYSLDKENRSIKIDHKTKVGDPLNLSLTYELTLANLKHRLGFYDGFFSLSGFYPSLTPVVNGEYSPRPFSKIGEVESLKTANFDISLTIPKGNVVAHTGEMESSEADENSNTYHIIAENVRDFSAFWSAKLTRRTRKTEKTTIKYYFNKDVTPADKLDLMEKALNTFGEAFGEYGHANLSVVLAPFAFAGTEYSEVAIVSDSLSESGKEEVILHEIAHQWWYMKVGSDQAFSPWLDETLAEFSTALFYLRNNEGRKFESFRQYGLAVLEKRILTNQPCAIKGAVYDFDEDSYSECVYTLGSLMWINFYSIKGPALIDDLRTYAEKFENKIATEKDLSEIVFQGFEAMLSGWLQGTVIV